MKQSFFSKYTSIFVDWKPFQKSFAFETIKRI